MSGLSHTPGKRAWGNTHRGFESRLLRQKPSKNAPLGAFFICTLIQYASFNTSRSKCAVASKNFNSFLQAILHAVDENIVVGFVGLW